nr:ATP-grasp domain-containing protein [uncultured Psychroserpens sp.]
MNSRINVLIIDGSSTWALSVVNCLSQCKDYKLFVLSSKKRTATKYSRYISHYKYCKKNSDVDWLRFINNEIESNNISVVVPVAEEEIRFFIKHSNQISKTANIIPLPELKDFETAVNKLYLSKFMSNHNLPQPKSFYIKNLESYKNIAQSIHYPILVKPLKGKGGDGIIKFDSVKNFEKHILNEELFVQEYIEGYDIDCSVLCLNGKVLTYTIQKGNMLGHNAYAPQLGVEFLDSDTVILVTRKLMSDLNWSGIAHVDLRYDKNTNDYKIIEVNARFWGSVEASKFAGVNFAELLIQTTLGEKNEFKPYKHIHYLRFKGVLKKIKRKPLSIFNFKDILSNTEVISVLKDPIPMLYKFREWLGRALFFNGIYNAF